MKKLSLLVLLFLSFKVASQQPDSLKFALLDSMSYEQLLQHYINEPEPIKFYKGPVELGDSSYQAMNALTVPTETVEAPPLFRYNIEEGFEESSSDTTGASQTAYWPKIALGFGKMGYTGDLYSKHFQPALSGRPAFNLDISQRILKYLQLDFSVLFGKIGANENLPDRHENFVSEIRSGGVNLLYDFGNFIPDRYRVRPFLSFGVSGFEFLSKTDIKDANGKTYYYWSDGSIKDLPEGSAGAQEAHELTRDYKYESDVRELNRDGFGKYTERAVAFPLGLGFIVKVTNRVDMKLNYQYFFTTTDYIDGITDKSVGSRAGNKKKDKFSYASFAFQYDLITKPKSKTYADTLTDAFWLAFDKSDFDRDGVPDMQDSCQGTPSKVAVDGAGCPPDDDGDGIPNYRDDEPNSAPGSAVNERGVTQSEAVWKDWYDEHLNDTLSTERETQVVYNMFAVTPRKNDGKKKKDEYTVELVRYTGPIPSDELAYLLSIGDISSTTLDDGKTVVYTTGKYDNLQDAIKRKEEFKLNGNNSAKVAKVSGNTINKIQEEDLDALLRKELEELMSIGITDEGDTLRNQSDSLDFFAGLFGDEFVNGSQAVKDSLIASHQKQKEEKRRLKKEQIQKQQQESSIAENEQAESFGAEDIVYRVQLGAFRNKISTSIFNTSTNVLELKTAENIYRYVTRGYKTIEQAASVRADLVIQGYSDAFVTAYKGGKRIPLSQTKATVDKAYVEDMNEEKIFSSIDKSLVAFKVQLGAPLKKPNQIALMEEKLKDLNDIEKQTTSVGGVRYTSGSFASYSEAKKHEQDLIDKGFNDAFLIATFKGNQIPIQEALELLK
ncbi:MAG TPA: SPOR domain-containing protein [Bacteroidia bacterium]|nr:SPOR domain-containing protein [Bacteroidia bacterium]